VVCKLLGYEIKSKYKIIKTTLLIDLLYLYTSKAIAQQPIIFDENEKATLSQSETKQLKRPYNLEGTTFKSVAFKFRKLNGIQYTMANGNEMFFSGNSYGDFVKFNSDRNSRHNITLYNNSQPPHGFIIGVVVGEEIVKI
jgi:hypothetical protein